MNNSNQAENLKALFDKIKDVKICMLTTVEADGTMHSRPMRNQKVDEDGSLWFFTGYESGKTSEIKNDSHVNLSYSDPGDNLYVSVSGMAMVTRDKSKIDELWTADMKAWFPEGKEDPNVALLKVTITKAEYWDAPNSLAVHLYSLAKATLTGQSYKTGDHDKINM
jgi:general stress protein 26